LRIVFDTNVLVSAFIARGASFEVFEHCLSIHDLFYSQYIRDEVEAVLLHKFSFPAERVSDALKFLDAQLTKIDVVALDAPVCRDADDDPVLACAISAEADCLISGDEDLLVLGECKQTTIIKPSDFWKFEKSRLA
jgi:uncharacterized protein